MPFIINYSNNFIYIIISLQSKNTVIANRFIGGQSDNPSLRDIENVEAIRY